MSTKTEQTTSTNDEWQNVEWTYCGRRMNSGKLSHLWLDERGERAIFSKGGSVIGGRYTLDVQRDGDELTARFGTLHFVGPYEDDDPDGAIVAGWTLEHRAAQTENEAVRAEKRLARETTGQMGPLTLRQVRHQYQRSTPMAQAGIAAAVLAYLEWGDVRRG